MILRWLSFLTAALVLHTPSHAQFPLPVNYTDILKSPVNPKITVSYKTPTDGTCSTVFSTQRQFTGYITLPPEILAPIHQNYTINTFFWFVEARQTPETAPLTIWLNGGPGSSSLIGLFTENGPCEVVQMADGTYGTQSRLWGWDRSSNVLYIDQPVQVGLSYDATTNSSFDLLEDRFFTPPTAQGGSGPAFTFLNGTFSSRNSYATANTSQNAAQAVWHFLQTFLYTFPEYNPGVQPNDTTTHPTGVNLFTESYGGEYGPVFADYFEHQNELLQIGQLPLESTLQIELASVGILNGLVDWRIQAPYFANFANNNTYGIKAIDSETMTSSLNSLQAPNGCLDQLDQCRKLMDAQDPAGEGDEVLVNKQCSRAFTTCAQQQNLLSTSGRSVYDIRQKDPSPFPSSAFIEYLNMARVQQAIGTPINYTQSNIVANSFYGTGDPIRDTQLPALGRLLDRGIRVAFLYGDADFICNWQGGEAISLSLATMLPTYSIPFPYAGYAQIVVNDSYVGGDVRQFGNLSFARIYDSGHLIPAYQPETAFTVFTRIIQGTALSTGEHIDLSTYATSGPQYSTKQNKQGSSQDAVCWIRAIQDTCTPDQRTQILAGMGTVMNGVWFAEQDDYKPPSSSVMAGSPGKPMPNVTQDTMNGGTTVAPTGVYTATGTPKNNAAGMAQVRMGAVILIAVVISLAALL